MNTQAAFRTADSTDTAEILALIQEYYAFDHIPFDEQTLRPALNQLLQDDALGTVFLMESQGASAGYCLLTFGFDLEFGGRVATVTDLYVRPAFRGQGLGTLALSQVEQTCRLLNIHAFELQVETRNLAAQRFYLRWGLQTHDRLPMSKRVEQDGFSALLR